MRKSGRTWRVNPDLGEDGVFNLYPPGNVEENAAAPECGVQRCVFRAIYRYAGRHEVLLYQLGVIAYGAIQAGQYNALALQFLVEFDSHDRGVALHDKACTLIDQR